VHRYGARGARGLISLPGSCRHRPGRHRGSRCPVAGREDEDNLGRPVREAAEPGASQVRRHRSAAITGLIHYRDPRLEPATVSLGEQAVRDVLCDFVAAGVDQITIPELVAGVVASTSLADYRHIFLLLQWDSRGGSVRRYPRCYS